MITPRGIFPVMRPLTIPPQSQLQGSPRATSGGGRAETTREPPTFRAGITAAVRLPGVWMGCAAGALTTLLCCVAVLNAGSTGGSSSVSIIGHSTHELRLHGTVHTTLSSVGHSTSFFGGVGGDDDMNANGCTPACEACAGDGSTTATSGAALSSGCSDQHPNEAAELEPPPYDTTAAREWFAQLQCPLHRSMWVVSTLTPNHPRAAHILERLTKLTTHSAWGVLLVSSTTSTDGTTTQPAPLMSVLGPNVVVLNVSLSTLAGLPLETARVLAQQLRFRAAHEWGRAASGADSEELLTAQARLHVSLKMLPYLIAIKCKASAIFDAVDDDVALFGEALAKVTPAMVEGPFDPDHANAGAALPPHIGTPPLVRLPTWPVLVTPRSDVAPVVNPYASLGGRAVHPRGFPAEMVYNASFQALHLQRQVLPVRPLIQQWVSHAYPDISYTDMAALRTHELPKLMKSTPTVIMEAGAWAPFNTRGTLFLPDAYWALFLSPAQPAYRSDVLRSYWATRLLWDTGGVVSFRSVASPPPPSDACGSDFGFHNERLSGGCEGTFLFRDIADRTRRTELLREELDLQLGLAPALAFIETWQYTPAPVLTPEGPDMFRRARALMCDVVRSSGIPGRAGQLAGCADCAALRAWLRDLGAAGYAPPVLPTSPTSHSTGAFHLQTPDPALLTFGDEGWRYAAPPMMTTAAAAAATKRGGVYGSSPPVALAVAISGLADRINTKVMEDNYQLPPYKRPPTSDELLLAHNLESLAAPFGGSANVHHFYVLGSYNVVESNLQLIIEGRLPFVAVVVHRDWVLEPLLPPNEQAHMPRHNSSFVTLKWTNEAQHYQKSQLHQVWEEAKAYELVASWQRRFGLHYSSLMRHRSDFNVTLFEEDEPATDIIHGWIAAPNWTDTVYIPEGEDWRGINDRIALGGSRAMATYLLRYYQLHYDLWDPSYKNKDYNHLWAEPFLNGTLRDAAPNITVLRLPQAFNYSEFPEIRKVRPYLGDDATRRR